MVPEVYTKTEISFTIHLNIENSLSPLEKQHEYYNHMNMKANKVRDVRDVWLLPARVNTATMAHRSTAGGRISSNNQRLWRPLRPLLDNKVTGHDRYLNDCVLTAIKKTSPFVSRRLSLSLAYSLLCNVYLAFCTSAFASFTSGSISSDTTRSVSTLAIQRDENFER